MNNPADVKVLLYKVIDSLIDSKRKKFGDSSYVRLLSAFVLQGKLGLMWKAIYELFACLRSGNYDFRVAFCANHFLNSIEREMKEAEIKTRDRSGVNIVNVMQYHKMFSDFFSKINANFSVYYKFWSELVEEKPKAAVLKDSGTIICSKNDEIEKAYYLLIETAGAQLKTIILYGNYLKYLVNDEEQAEKIMTKASNMIGNRVTGKTIAVAEVDKRFADSSNAAIAVVGGDRETLGRIMGVNSEMLKMFEYTVEEVKGRSVNMLMPKVYADNHTR